MLLSHTPAQRPAQLHSLPAGTPPGQLLRPHPGHLGTAAPTLLCPAASAAACSMHKQ